jgi:ABC-type Fe3+/spermidine/putrescine transport system ATPase subunit
MSLLEVTALSKEFDGLRALDEVSLTAGQGEISQEFTLLQVERSVSRESPFLI